MRKIIIAVAAFFASACSTTDDRTLHRQAVNHDSVCARNVYCVTIKPADLTVEQMENVRLNLEAATKAR